jgi:hypothetical protein
MARSAAVLEAALRQVPQSEALTDVVMDGQDLEPGMAQ